MEVLIVVLVVLVVVASVGGVAYSRRNRGPELEPPAKRPATRPAPRPEPIKPAAAKAAAAKAPVQPKPPTPPKPPTETAPDVVVEPTPEELADLEAEAAAALAEPEVEEEAPEEEAEELEPLVKPRFRDRLSKAAGLFGGYLGGVRSKGKIDDGTWDDLEEALILADIGAPLAASMLEDLRRRVKAEGITTPDALLEALKADLKKSLAPGERDLRIDPGMTNVWLFVGVNGVGKTTTIGKLARQQAELGRSVVMAAGDTFRAAAADQLEMWAKRTGADIVRGAEGGDPGAVIFDAVARANARSADVVLADTAGRLHNKVNLMEELRKVRRVAEKEPGHVTEVLLVIDATTGQNGLNQAKEFASAVGVTGIVLTKLDGTAKGGIAFAIQNTLGLPIKLVGLGETAGDLVAFDPDEFVDALFQE